MAAPVDPGAYKELILFLGTAGVIVPLFHRLRISPVLGFIAAGALLGPFGLGRFTGDVPGLHWFTIASGAEVAHLAEFGVVFLLFTIGIELSWERLRVLRRLVFGMGAAQVVLSAVVLGGLAFLLGMDPGTAALAGMALALSSTAIVIPILAEARRLNSPAGRTSFSMLLFQDLAVAPILFTIAAVGRSQDGGVVVGLVLAFGQAAFAIAVIVLAGRLALRPLFQLVAQTRSPELFMAASLLVVIATSLVSAMSGLSMALGAFIAGLLLAETEYRRAIEAMIEPFKGLLLGVFFLSVGMGLDVTAVAQAPVAIFAAAIGLIAVKTAIVVGLARLFRLPLRVGIEAGLLLGAGGEFAFVLVGAALVAKLVTDDIAQALLVVTTVSMIMIPVLARLARQLGRRRTPPPGAEAPAPTPADTGGRVLVAGYGRVGQLVCDMLARHGVPYLAVDANPTLVALQRALGKPVYFGDSTSPLFLRACGIESAKALVITLDQPSGSQMIVESVRRWQPNLTIVARARDAQHASALYRLGVTDAVPETIEASLQLSEAVLVDIGVPMGQVIASIHERRDEFRRVFQVAEADGLSDKASDAAEARRPSGVFRARRSAGRRAADAR
jgi:CPA2 family monovalent cation:H+ antiporter-2